MLNLSLRLKSAQNAARPDPQQSRHDRITAIGCGLATDHPCMRCRSVSLRPKHPEIRTPQAESGLSTFSINNEKARPFCRAFQ
jgi:hypothetical protein